MVFLSKVVLSFQTTKKKTFLDKIRVYVRGGGGGQGLPKYGGRGGQGGHVYVVGEEGATLKNLVQKFPSKRFIADQGRNSHHTEIFAEAGHHFNIPVPPGIIVRTDLFQVLGEINKPGDLVLVAKGGEGGSPNNNYRGQKSKHCCVTLDLKLIADIGLVGFPNAGKSTLLSALSRADPKIASYPFTTVQPQLGTMVYEEDLRQITVADLPGLIEGAHINVGMGHSFLKHIERTSLLLFVIDINGFRLGAKHKLRSALENVFLLNKELELYKPELVDKPALLVINKVDIPGTAELTKELVTSLKDLTNCSESIAEEFMPKKLIKFDEVIPISAKHRDNTDYLMQRLRKLLDVYADKDFMTTHENDDRSLDVHFTEHRGGRLT